MINNPIKAPYNLVVLAVLDGWGITRPGQGNAISQAKTPFFDKSSKIYRRFLLEASGKKVGLPSGVFGNSEVGHLNLGAGRVVCQDILRIDEAIKNGDFRRNQAFGQAIAHVKKEKGVLHIMGLVSDGRVHSSLNHLFALLETAKENKVKEILVHVFLDGRDTPYNSGIRYVKKLEEKMRKIGVGRIASVIGRFYAMDRDNHWEWTKRAYRLITEGEGEMFESAEAGIKAKYQAGIYDEEMTPIAIGKRIKICAKDAVIFFNYRADRARQLTKAFVADKTPQELERKRRIKGLVFLAMTRYEKDLPCAVAFPPIHVEQGFGETISQRGLKQLRLAETEKYAHVTYFFNGGVEKPFPGEDRQVIPSPRVESYAQAPAMSAKQIADKAVAGIRSGQYSFILINFANADMVGHTGNIKAAIKGIETVDGCLSRIYRELAKQHGVLLVTADHGNADSMFDNESGEIVKEHSYSPVPFIIIHPDFRQSNKGRFYLEKVKGALANVAPTILELLKIAKPEEMDGKSLV